MVRKDHDTTRRALIRSAFQQMRTHGYRGAHLADIARRAGMTKGALFYYFESKVDLARAVIDDFIAPRMWSAWLTPLETASDPIRALHTSFCSADGKSAPADGLEIVYIGLDMAAAERPLRAALSSIQDAWTDGVAKAIEQGAKQGMVRRDVDPYRAALNLLALLVGTQTVDALSSARLHRRILEVSIVNYLESLRPAQSSLH